MRGRADVTRVPRRSQPTSDVLQLPSSPSTSCTPATATCDLAPASAKQPRSELDGAGGSAGSASTKPPSCSAPAGGMAGGPCGSPTSWARSAARSTCPARSTSWAATRARTRDASSSTLMGWPRPSPAPTARRGTRPPPPLWATSSRRPRLWRMGCGSASGCSVASPRPSRATVVAWPSPLGLKESDPMEKTTAVSAPRAPEGSSSRMS